MKKILIIMMCALSLTAYCQNPLSLHTQLNVDIGLSTPSYYGGKELLRARDLRNNGLSYYEGINGRKSVGAYAKQSGWTLSASFYKPVKWVPGLMLGSKVTSSLTGSTPKDGYAEGYYFNNITANVAARYYPFKKINLFYGAEVGMASVLTKNRFINNSGGQNFLHQFGIGINAGANIGYSKKIGKNGSLLNFMITYNYMQARVEVNGIGDDKWKFGNIGASIGISF